MLISKGATGVCGGKDLTVDCEGPCGSGFLNVGQGDAVFIAEMRDIYAGHGVVGQKNEGVCIGIFGHGLAQLKGRYRAMKATGVNVKAGGGRSHNRPIRQISQAAKKKAFSQRRRPVSQSKVCSGNARYGCGMVFDQFLSRGVGVEHAVPALGFMRRIAHIGGFAALHVVIGIQRTP